MSFNNVDIIFGKMLVLYTSNLHVTRFRGRLFGNTFAVSIYKRLAVWYGENCIRFTEPLGVKWGCLYARRASPSASHIGMPRLHLFDRVWISLLPNGVIHFEIDQIFYN